MSLSSEPSHPEVFGRYFRADVEQSQNCADEFSRRHLVLDDERLLGPADRYSISELWCYVHHLWDTQSGENHILDNMTGIDGEFSFDRARDVMLAALDNFTTMPEIRHPADVLPEHVFALIQIIVRFG